MITFFSIYLIAGLLLSALGIIWCMKYEPFFEPSPVKIVCSVLIWPVFFISLVAYLFYEWRRS